MLGHKRLVDKMIDAYVTWRETCLAVSDTYDSWTRESARPRGGNRRVTVTRLV